MEQALIRVMFHLFVEISSMVTHLILIAPCFLVTDQFTADAASTTMKATGQKLVSLCRSVCVEQESQLLDPPMSS